MALPRFLLWMPLFLVSVCSTQAGEPGQSTPVTAVIEASLTSAAKQIRQFAMDDNPDTYFASVEKPKKDDHLTVVFDRPVAVKSLAVTSGRPGGEERFAGDLEGSADGKAFERLAMFADGTAFAKADGRMLKAIRIKATADAEHPLVLREIAIVSKPAVATFRYPIEIVVDVSDAPEMKEWGEKVARLCERNYPMICDELRSDGFKPPTTIRMALKNDYKGVAAAGGNRITGSVKYFKSRPEDMGAMIHETAHCVQAYRTRGNPGWLVEGVADYIRFFKYEPGNLGRINPDRARYDGSYRVSAAFLAYVTDKYDKQLVRKLNQAMREGEYRETIWQALTRKTVQELGDEWRASLQRKTEAGAAPSQ